MLFLMEVPLTNSANEVGSQGKIIWMLQWLWLHQGLGFWLA